MSGAVLSDCGKYRYSLEREWMTGGGTCLFVMLNPSTADATEDDPTIRRCIGFAQRWGYQRLTVGNLFAYRATDPRELREVDDPGGPENPTHLGLLAREADRVVAAWGAFPVTGAKWVDVVLSEVGGPLYCLGTTANGSPRHPLYVKSDTELREYARSAVAP
jgi:hypothetical protein